MTFSELLLFIKSAQNTSSVKLDKVKAFELWMFKDDKWICVVRLFQPELILNVFNMAIVPVAICIDFGFKRGHCYIATEINEIAAKQLDEFQIADLTAAIIEGK